MKTLWLLRHAKAGPADSNSDHERPLSARGRDDAERMGRYLASRGRPQLVLCSSALRTRETLDRLQQAFERPLGVEIDRELYLASPGGLLSRLQDGPEEAASLLLIGHNPGIGELALMLANSGPPTTRQQMRMNYPTCALAELQLDAKRWSGLSKGCALVDFTVPKGIPELP